MLPAQFTLRLLAISVLFITISFTASFAQKNKAAVATPDIKFGVISREQFTGKLADSTAEAVVLYEAGDVSYKVNVDESWVVFSYHIRTLIRRRSAYRFATVEIPARRGIGTLHEIVEKIEGNTYNIVNGDIVTTPMDLRSAHFIDKITGKYWVEKFTMPNVQEGSIIEYKYTIRTPFNISSSPKTWRFQRDIPVAWSQYRIVLPVRYPYKLLLGGSLQLTINEAKPVKIYLVPGQTRSDAQEHFYAIKNIPVFQPESYMAAEEDYISKIDFEPPNYYDLHTDVEFAFSWGAIDKRLLSNGNFGPRIEPNDWLRKRVHELFPDQKDSLSRAIDIFNYVRRTMVWNGDFSLWGGEAKMLLTERKGDTGDINLLLIGMLRAAQIKAYPVILSTRSHGSITEELALMRKFNCVIAQVYVGGKVLLLDATDPYIKPGILPIHCLNGIGRLIDPSGSRFVSLAPIDRLREVRTATFVLNESGELDGTIIASYSGYGAWVNNKLLASTGEANYLENIYKINHDWQVKKATFIETNKSEDTFGVEYKIVISDAGIRTGDILYFRPIISKFPAENPFKSSYRRYPIDFVVPMDETFTATYTLPRNFVVEELPKPVSITLPGDGGRFMYQAEVDKNQLRVSSRFSIRKSLYSSNEYPALRELFNLIVAKHAEHVTLKRIIPIEK